MTGVEIRLFGFRELTNRMTEDRCSQMLEELLTIKEDLNRVRLDKELMEQNRAEGQSLLAYLEKTKSNFVSLVYLIEHEVRISQANEKN